ncbi:MAG: hypothetical protein HKN43_07565 [Rhodothermales bacterium]|nr:hypothetical protein [Rhodothermales bacterium]
MDSHTQRFGSYESIRAYVAAWAPSVLLGLAGAFFTITRNDYSFMDAIDLVIHEAGHIFFAFFGEFIRMAGGTLMQIILPAGLAAYFYANNYRLGHQIMLFWLGQSLLNVSVYAADASARSLPLLGGSQVTHDWHYMLQKTGMLEYDYLIADVFVVLAVSVFVLMVLTPKHMM